VRSLYKALARALTGRFLSSEAINVKAGLLAKKPADSTQMSTELMLSRSGSLPPVLR
jgi:hypothetical protein